MNWKTKKQANRETVGHLSTELLKNYDPVTPTEQAKEMLEKWESNMQTVIDRGRSRYQKDFFVVIETKKERLMENVLRNYFIDRKTCPMPNYDQTVFKYHYTDEVLEFVWVIPARDICRKLIDNVLLLPADHKDLINFVLNFRDGTLALIAKKLNGEEIDSPLLIKE